MLVVYIINKDALYPGPHQLTTMDTLTDQPVTGNERLAFQSALISTRLISLNMGDFMSRSSGLPAKLLFVPTSGGRHGDILSYLVAIVSKVHVSEVL